MTVTAVAQPWAAGPALASFSCCHLTGRGLVQRRRSYTRFVHDKPDQGTAGHVLVSPAAGVRDEGSRAFNKGCGSKPRRQSITTTTDSAHSKLTPKICTALSGRQTVTSSLPSPLQYSPAKSKCQQMTPSGVSHVSERGPGALWTVWDAQSRRTFGSRYRFPYFALSQTHPKQVNLMNVPSLYPSKETQRRDPSVK